MDGRARAHRDVLVACPEKQTLNPARDTVRTLQVKYLPGIHNPVRVKSLLDLPHDGDFSL